jgi:hypothetical protein
MRGSDERSEAALDMLDAILGDVVHTDRGGNMRETQGVLRKERCIETKA